MFYEIALGPRRQLRCTCGHTWTMKPTEYELPEPSSTTINACVHIRRLYSGNPVLHLNQVFAGKIYLTPLGETHFHHRWAANALK